MGYKWKWSATVTGIDLAEGIFHWADVFLRCTFFFFHFSSHFSTATDSTALSAKDPVCRIVLTLHNKLWVCQSLIALEGWQQFGVDSTSSPNSLWIHSLFSSQHHRVAIQTVDIIVVSPRLLGIHAQSLTVHHLIQNLCGERKYGEGKESRGIQNRECSDGRRERRR